jgi:disulfide bond formation protein DsbB
VAAAATPRYLKGGLILAERLVDRNGSGSNSALSKAIPVAIVLASLGALAFAYIGQYGFGLEPCILCLYERVPYALAAGVALLAAVLPLHTTARAALVGICGIIFFAGAALAFYHVGVEQHWWAAITGCGGAPASDFTVEDLQAWLQGPALKPCDQVDWRLFGISLAGYNGLLSLALAIGSFIGAGIVKAGHVKPGHVKQGAGA